jgi:hypothetical protein
LIEIQHSGACPVERVPEEYGGLLPIALLDNAFRGGEQFCSDDVRLRDGLLEAMLGIG